MTSRLPIYEIIPKLKKAFSASPSAVLEAPPGAGKTTVVPLELLNESWLKGKKIIMLEPRRLAARAAARRMADTLGEKVGKTVGYRVRMDSKVGPETKIEVVTEGVLIRKLQSDPELSDVGLIIFDEFHERSLEADLGLALSLDVQEGLRDDLKLLVMSATMDGEKTAALLGAAPIISSEGRSYPIDYHYINKKITGYIENEVASLIFKALSEESGSILVFLPGAGEIERTKKILQDKGLGAEILLCPLYGMMSFLDQDQAISPAPEGTRKIVLATAIAETSLTIEGIRIVIDSGLSRGSSFDLRSGMTKLVTSTVPRASADQRAGRAGRTQEGVCYRLWTEAANRALIPFAPPEIKNADLVPLMLDLAFWGISDVTDLKWLDVPDRASVDQAKSLLMSLEALDQNGSITAHGKKMARFPMHPRFAHMIIKAHEKGLGTLALVITALLDERDILYLKPEQRTADLRLRLDAIEHIKKGEKYEAKKLGTNFAAVKNILRQVKIWQKAHHISPAEYHIEKAGLCLSIAFPERVACLRDASTATYLLSGGRGAKLQADDALALEKYLAIGHLDKGSKDARIFLAAPLVLQDIEELFKNAIQSQEKIYWDDRSKAVKAEKKKLFGKMPLSISRIEAPDPEQIMQAMIVGLRKEGLDILPWDKKSRILQKRVELVREYLQGDFANFSEAALMAELESWLAPYLSGIASKGALTKLDLHSILKNSLSYDQSQKIDKLTPSHIRVPSGSNIAIDYESDPPVLSVKLQEMFGAVSSPKILGDSLSLQIHLLSPARRPLQITMDLEGFWQNAYSEIKKEMKGRYPKHPWPDDPLQAIASRKLKPKK